MTAESFPSEIIDRAEEWRVHLRPSLRRVSSAPTADYAKMNGAPTFSRNDCSSSGDVKAVFSHVTKT